MIGNLMKRIYKSNHHRDNTYYLPLGGELCITYYKERSFPFISGHWTNTYELDKISGIKKPIEEYMLTKIRRYNLDKSLCEFLK